MAPLFLNICVILLLTKDTLAVGFDYMDVEDDEELSRTSKTPAPNSNDNTALKQGDAMYHDKSPKNRPFTESRKLFDQKNIKSSEPTTPTTLRPTLTTMKEFPYDMFLDYDYRDYDRNTRQRNKSNTKKPSKIPALRTQKPILNVKAKVVINANTNLFNTTVVVTEDSVNDEIFNLDPAVDQLSLTNYHLSASDIEDHNTWYVPEKYPCWELPTIYGRPEKMNDTSKIFLIYPLKLKSVQFDEISEVNEFESSSVSANTYDSNQYNKWCAMPPCYGDHTLCVYPTRQYSKICEEGYQVRTPETWEQIALVNKLNSMRNHVAKGTPNQYPYLPPASNMNQVMYDYDLEMMTRRWLRQCLPGPPPCLSLENENVAQLECTKFLNLCCVNTDPATKCTPKEDCFVNPVIGCLHAWFWSSNLDLDTNDVECGHIEVTTFNLAQLIWAKTTKVGCAYGEEPDGNMRVMCSFAPGAPFFLDTKFYCGFISLTDNRHMLQTDDVTDIDFLHHMFNIDLTKRHINKIKFTTPNVNQEQVVGKIGELASRWDIISLRNTYKESWVRSKLRNYTNGTFGLIARLVTRYKFYESTRAKCDTNEPVYQVGAPGAMCAETGRKYYALCYEYRDPTPGYRLAAILASIGLFSLILYDLFSGVMRQLHM